MLHKTVGELEQTMTAREMMEWEHFLALQNEQDTQAQAGNEKLLGQVLKFDAQLKGMKSMTRAQVQALDNE